MSILSTILLTVAGVTLIWLATLLALRLISRDDGGAAQDDTADMGVDEFTAAMHRRIEMTRRQAR